MFTHPRTLVTLFPAHSHRDLKPRRSRLAVQRPSIERLEDRTMLAADFGLAFALDSTGSSVELGANIETDAAGNAYVTGYYNGVMDADPNGGSPLNSGGNDDAFVAKYDSAGSLVWARTIGGSAFTRATGIALDASGNVFVAGGFTGTGDFNPGVEVHNLSSIGSNDGFLLKLNNSGDFVRAFNVGGSGNDGIGDLAVDGNDSVYTVGTYQSHVGGVDFDPSGSTFAPSINGGGSQDVFVAKYDASGNLNWAKAFGSYGYDGGMDIAVDSSGNVFTAGDFWGGDIDPGPGVQIAASHGGRDAFVQKLDTNGNFLWGGTIGGAAGNNVESGLTVAIDSTGASYFGGIFALTADLDPGPGENNFTAVGPTVSGLDPFDSFLIKLNQTGGLVWAQQLGGTGFDRISDLRIDRQDHVWAAGHYQDTVDFDPSEATANETAGIGTTVTGGFVWELDSNAGFLSVTTIDGPPVSYVGPTGMSIDLQGNIWTTGSFSNTVDFDPGPDTFNLTPVDGPDVFVSKLAQQQPVEIDIKPGSDPNSINLGSNGTVPVAILGSATFDATTVDPVTVTLADASVKVRGKGTPMAAEEDVNGDGLLDLVVHVETDGLALTEGVTEAVLEGETFDGVSIRGRATRCESWRRYTWLKGQEPPKASTHSAGAACRR